MVQPDRLFPYRVGAAPAGVDLDSLRRMLANIYAEFQREGYFQLTLGWTCVDDNRPAIDPSHLIFEETGADLWPFEQTILRVDETWVFGIVEYLYSKSKKPVEKSWHSWNDCGWHVSSGDADQGRSEFRTRVNRVLARYGSGFELQESGELWSASPEGLADIRVAGIGDDTSDRKVARAVSQFRSYAATPDDKRAAIRELADVLEELRERNARRAPREEEARLFEIANNYGIRHHNAQQNREYSESTWLDWIFYSFLNAIALASRNQG